MAKKKKGSREEVSGAIDNTPRRHEELSERLTERVESLFESVGKHLRPTLETWVEGFRNDANPHIEILVWEAIAEAFAEFSEANVVLSPKQTVTELSSLSTGARAPSINARLVRIWDRVWDRYEKRTALCRQQMNRGGLT